jgi:hypothetical protein
VAVIVMGIFEAWSRHVQKVVLYTALAMMTIIWKLNNVSAEDPTETD